MVLRLFAVLATMVGLTFAFAGVATADDSIDSVVSQLKSSPVYVSDEIDGGPAIKANLESVLQSDDAIFLVAVPKSAAADTQDYAKRIAQALGPHVIVGLMVGDTAVGYSADIPTVTADLMKRATAVSTNVTETLVTYVQNMHQWLQAHPQPKPPPPPAPPEHFSPIPYYTGGGLTVAAGLVVGGLLWRKRRMEEIGYVKLRSPRRYRGTLRSVLMYREQVRDSDLAESLRAIAVDADHYFQSIGSKENAGILHTDLRKIQKVLEKYVEIESSPRYFRNQEALLAQGRQSILSFQDFVLDVARQGNEQAIGEFDVDTRILQDAHHYL